MKSTQKFRAPENVMSREIGDEGVLLDLATGTYFGLNSVGFRAWQLMIGGHTFGEILNQILSEFDGTDTDVDADIEELIDHLVNAKLLALVDEA